jgi:superfamily II DNA/RNA helicase
LLVPIPGSGPKYNKLETLVVSSTVHDGAPAVPSFADLGVPDDLVAVLTRQGIETPFPIQVATIRDAFAGRDVLGRAPTGSGKTLAFGIPVIAALTKAKPRRPTGLILSPTRELAEQIRRELQPLASVRNRSLLAIYGGVGFRDQLQGLRNGADLLVACPGRLQDLLNQGEVSLDSVTSVVVDEADRMADMGFLPAVRQLLDLTSTKRQTVLFSATLGKEVQVLTKAYQSDPVTHEVGEVDPDLSLVNHRFIKTQQAIKVPLAAQVIAETGPTVLFCRTRHGVDRVARQLKDAGVRTGWIHGGRSQNQRDAALHAFTTGRVQALVATDVAARGIHVDGVQCVIHFDPPEDDKAYVHRSGRTARAGARGTVVSFINSDQVKDTSKLQRQLSLPAAFEEQPTDLEPVAVTNRGRGGTVIPAKGGGGSNSSHTDRRPPGRSRDQSATHADRRPRQVDRPGDGERARTDDPSPARRESGRAETVERTDENGETFRDWTPPKKRSNQRKGVSSARDGKKRGGPGNPIGKRTGKPRVKKKAGAGPGGHRKGSSPKGGSSRGSSSKG